MRPYLAGVVLDAEATVRQAVVGEELGILAEAALKVLVLSTDSVQLVQEGLVRDCPRPQALLIQHGQDAVLVLSIIRGINENEKGSVEQMHCAKKNKCKTNMEVSIEMCVCTEMTCVVSKGEGRHTYILNEVTDNSVVEILDVGPLDALRQKT